MMPSKKNTKSKFEDFEDFMDETKYLKDTPKNKKATKRPQAETETIDDEIPQSERKCPTNVKKQKEYVNVQNCKELRGKLLEAMEGQLKTRKQGNDALLNSLSEVIGEIKEDCMVLQSNQEKIHKLAATFVKCVSQATTAQEKKLTTLTEIHSAFKKQVEGLLTRGGIKPDDRPIWFDVYKAFPPIVEPKLDRPQPEIKPIRQILYKEDAVRAEFHSKGHGLAAVNMLNPTGETQTKKLLQQYEKQKSAGVPNEELIQKCVDAVGSERQARQETPRITVTDTLNPKSVSAQVLADADLKNIFNQEEKK